MTRQNRKYRPTKQERELAFIARSRAEEQRRLVNPETLEQTIAAYIEWEALILWVRAIVTANKSAPPIVIAHLQNTCPGFLEYAERKQERDDASHLLLWPHLYEWLELNAFAHAKADGWFDAVSFYARRDERLRRA